MYGYQVGSTMRLPFVKTTRKRVIAALEIPVSLCTIVETIKWVGSWIRNGMY